MCAPRDPGRRGIPLCPGVGLYPNGGAPADSGRNSCRRVEILIACSDRFAQDWASIQKGRNRLKMQKSNGSRRESVRRVRRAVNGRSGGAGAFAAERLERRVLLSAAIAAFGPQQAYLAGTNPLSLAAADFNNDGKIDLAIASNTLDSVGVLPGDGSGTFPGRQNFPAGSGPIFVAAADLNGDGRRDLITANYGGQSVSVLLGNGDATFQPQHTFATGNGPIWLAVADVNGDGKPDVIASNY